MSLPREDYFDLLAAALAVIDLDDLRKEPSSPIAKDTTAAIDIAPDGEDDDNEFESMEADARLFNCSVGVTARTRQGRARIMLEVERVLARLVIERFLRSVPRPSFGRTGPGEAERPALTASYAVAIPYRVKLEDPAVEV